MSEERGYLSSLLANIRVIRERAKITASKLEDKLILGPGWIERIERGESIPSIDMLLAILHETGSNLHELIDKLPKPEPALIHRVIFAEPSKGGIVIHFRYANHDAKYQLSNCTIAQYDRIIKSLKDGLARLNEDNEGKSEAVKTDSVARCFHLAVKYWPKINPSDIWWFIVYRAYCDPYNHPASFARMDFTQSWKRTGGWALEEILVRHYGQFLKENGVNIYIANSSEKDELIENFKLKERIEADKIDVVLTGDTKAGTQFFGVVHVKASFAERRTDDVPLSQALIKAGYISPLWTMDCKSTPGSNPKNRGELGSSDGHRSAKRKDFEDEGYFTGCFSYNSNTQASAKTIPEDRRVYVCNFSDANDEFSQFIIRNWRKMRKS